MMMVDSANRLIVRLVAQHRELADRPDLREVRARRFVGEVDDVRLEGRVVLVEGDEDLLTEGREGMEVELERLDGREWIVRSWFLLGFRYS